MNEIAVTQKKLETKYKTQKASQLIDSALYTLKQLQRELTDDAIDELHARQTVQSSIASLCGGLAEDQKEMYNAQSKHGKAIAKRFKTDISVAPVMLAMTEKQALTDNAIVMHLLRQGDFENAESFATGTGVPLDEDLMNAFKALYGITASLQAGELSQAIDWANSHRTELERRHSSLEFNLHKAQYIRIFKTSHVFEAIKYAQEHFPQFGKTHMKEIQQLFAALAFHAHGDASPYQHLFAPIQPALHEIFARDYLALLHMGIKPPLQTTVEAAAVALPTHIKLASLKVNQKATEKEKDGTAPTVEVDLPARFRYHSVFVCPVSRDVSATGFLLACGHVIGVEALQGLARGTNKLKCIYCPTLSNVAEARPLIF